MSFFVAKSQLYSIIYDTDDFLRSVGYNQVQRCVITWLLKTMMITFFYFYQFHARPYFNNSTICKAWIFLITLTSAWAEPLMKYPILFVAVHFLETFFFTIGPFINMTNFHFIFPIMRQPRGPAIIRWLTDDLIITDTFMLIDRYLSKSSHWYTFMKIAPLITFTAMLYRDTMERNERLDRRAIQTENLREVMEELNRRNAQG